jgi:hypothetical protein
LGRATPEAAAASAKELWACNLQEGEMASEAVMENGMHNRWLSPKKKDGLHSPLEWYPICHLFYISGL